MKKKSFKEKLDRFLRSKGFLIGMLIFGLLILMYPLISNSYYTIKQKSYNQEYEKTIEGMSTEEIEKILQEADTFNDNLYTFGGSDLFTEQKLKFIEESLENETFPTYFLPKKLIGTIEIPKIKSTLPIFSGVDDSILEKASGFMFPSSLPIGGSNTHSIITAHRGLPQSRLFRDLGQLKKGDLFFVKVLGETLAYETDGTTIIKPTDFSRLGITENADEVTLLTCHPYTINSHRLLVKGHRVDYSSEIEKIAKDQQKNHAWRLFFEQYKEYMIGCLLFALLFGIVSFLEKRKRKRGE